MPDALFFLAAVEVRGGRGQDAVPLLERLLKRASDYPRARETLALARQQAAPPPAGSAHLRLLRVSERGQAEAAARRAAAGEDFAALARAHSDDTGSAANGGDLGWANPGQMVPEFEKAMTALKPNQLSKPVQTPFGLHCSHFS